MRKHVASVLIFIMTGILVTGEAAGQQNLAQQLGFEADAKLLIVHADDIGLSQSVNGATLEAFSSGGITSGSMMVPCPWFNDFAHSYQSHPDLDVGIHITLTSEWDLYKFGGVLPSTEIPSLVNEQGYFYPTTEEVGLHADPREAELEIRAQIDRAIAAGIRPTHLDTHMGSVLATPELIQIYFKLGMEYGIPVFVPRMLLLGVPEAQQELIKKEFVLVDQYFMLNLESPDASWEEAYREILDRVGPGLNVLIVHLAHDNAEMQAITVNHPAFGSTWREKDLNYVQSQTYRDLLEKNHIQLVTWKEVGAANRSDQ
jgi:chitin disaccharide deacetylase